MSNNQNIKVFFIPVISTFLMIFFGCGSFQYSSSGNVLKIEEVKNTDSQTLPIKDKDGFEKYRKNRELWRGFNLDNYKYTARVFEGGNTSYADPVLIEVKEKQPVAVTPVSKSDKRSTELYKKIDTIEKIFDLIEKSFKINAEVEIEYDKKYGFPKKIMLDDSRKGIHGWLAAEVSKLEPINKELNNN